MRRIRLTQIALATSQGVIPEGRILVVGEDIDAELAQARLDARTAEEIGDDFEERDALAEALLGSSSLPAMVDLGNGEQIQLGGVVLAVHAASGLSVDDWNGMPEPLREAMLAVGLGGMLAVASFQTRLDAAVEEFAAVINGCDAREKAAVQEAADLRRLLDATTFRATILPATDQNGTIVPHPGDAGAPDNPPEQGRVSGEAAGEVASVQAAPAADLQKPAATPAAQKPARKGGKAAAAKAGG